MRFTAMLLTGIALAGAASAQDYASEFENDEWAQRVEKTWAVRERADELRPVRRDHPLRYLNISDDEVREIELVVRAYLPRALVNISPVVTGCPCEEGPNCTDQVFIVANTATHSVGLQLSRVKQRWMVGLVQKWWLQWADFESRKAKMDYFESEAREWELVQRFPVCLIPATTRQQ